MPSELKDEVREDLILALQIVREAAESDTLFSREEDDRLIDADWSGVLQLVRRNLLETLMYLQELQREEGLNRLRSTRLRTRRHALVSNLVGAANELLQDEFWNGGRLMASGGRPGRNFQRVLQFADDGLGEDAEAHRRLQQWRSPKEK